MGSGLTGLAGSGKYVTMGSDGTARFSSGCLLILGAGVQASIPVVVLVVASSLRLQPSTVAQTEVVEVVVVFSVPLEDVTPKDVENSHNSAVSSSQSGGLSSYVILPSGSFVIDGNGPRVPDIKEIPGGKMMFVHFGGG